MKKINDAYVFTKGESIEEIKKMLPKNEAG